MDSDRSSLTVDAGRAWQSLAILAACTGYVMLVALRPAFAAQSPFFCVLFKALGMHCASCGLTRGLACLVRGDPLAAVRYHPLVPFVALCIAIVTLDTTLRAVRLPSLVAAIPPAMRRCLLLSLLAAFVVVFAVRAMTWLAPAWNSPQLFIPPATFPPAAVTVAEQPTASPWPFALAFSSAGCDLQEDR